MSDLAAELASIDWDTARIVSPPGTPSFTGFISALTATVLLCIMLLCAAVAIHLAGTHDPKNPVEKPKGTYIVRHPANKLENRDNLVKQLPDPAKRVQYYQNWLKVHGKDRYHLNAQDNSLEVKTLLKNVEAYRFLSSDLGLCNCYDDSPARCGHRALNLLSLLFSYSPKETGPTYYASALKEWAHLRKAQHDHQGIVDCLENNLNRYTSGDYGFREKDIIELSVVLSQSHVALGNAARAEQVLQRVIDRTREIKRQEEVRIELVRVCLFGHNEKAANALIPLIEKDLVGLKAAVQADLYWKLAEAFSEANCFARAIFYYDRAIDQLKGTYKRQHELIEIYRKKCLSLRALGRHRQEHEILMQCVQNADIAVVDRVALLFDIISNGSFLSDDDRVEQLIQEQTAKYQLLSAETQLHMLPMLKKAIEHCILTERFDLSRFLLRLAAGGIRQAQPNEIVLEMIPSLGNRALELNEPAIAENLQLDHQRFIRELGPSVKAELQRQLLSAVVLAARGDGQASGLLLSKILKAARKQQLWLLVLDTHDAILQTATKDDYPSESCIALDDFDSACRQCTALKRDRGVFILMTLFKKAYRFGYWSRGDKFVSRAAREQLFRKDPVVYSLICEAALLRYRNKHFKPARMLFEQLWQGPVEGALSNARLVEARQVYAQLKR